MAWLLFGVNVVWQGKCDDEPSLTPALQVARERMKQIALQLGRHQRSCGLDVDPEEYATSHLHCGLMEVSDAAVVDTVVPPSNTGRVLSVHDVSCLVALC